MADGDDDKGKGGDNADEEQQQSGRPTLADVHARVMAELEDETDADEGTDEDADATAAGDGSDDAAAGDGDDDTTDEDDADAAGGDADEDEQERAKTEAAAADQAKTDADAAAASAASDAANSAAELTPPELEADDTAKPGKYKAEFIDIDGNKFYVTSTKDLPEDFEPKNQRAYGVAIESLQEKKQQYQADTRDYEQAKDRQDRATRVTEVKKEWAADQDELDKSGRLPKDTTERQKVTDAVFGIIAEELNKGRVVSFKDAYYRHNDAEQRRAEKAAVEAKAKAAADLKKKRGAKVMGSGGGTGSQPTSRSSNGSVVMPGPRPGTTLADVHARVMSGY